MTAGHAMIGRRFDVRRDVAWVDLDPVATRPETVDRNAFRVTYYDTNGLRLARAGITLTRRTGPVDRGWRLAVPTVGDGRTEWSVPLADHGNKAVPADLLDRVQARARNHKVRPVAVLTTRRTAHSYLGSTGRVMVIGADDRVTARFTRPAGPGKKRHGREWNFQFDSSVTAGATPLVTNAGGRPAPWSTPLHHALGHRLHPTRLPHPGELNRRSSAGDVLRAHLTAQVNALVTHDYQARHDEPDGVHQMRVATRRLRSALSTFRPLLDRQVTDPLRAELTWLGGKLGAARDAEVLRDRVLSGLPDEPNGPVTGSVSDRIATELHADHRAAHDQLIRTLRSRRYFALLDRLDAMITDPPFTPLAEHRAGKVLTKLVDRSYRRLHRLVTAGPSAVGRDGPDPWFHEIRKGAKRLRYAAEAVRPAFGEPAGALAGAAEHLQEVLGEHQDSVVARKALRDIGTRIRDHTDSATTIRVLHAREQARSDETATDFTAAWAALTDPRLRTWLK